MLVKALNLTQRIKYNGSSFIKVKIGPIPPVLFCTVTVESNDSSLGTALGSGTYTKGSTVHISAISNAVCKFMHWSDGSIDSERDILCNEDIHLTAFFEKDTEGILLYIPNKGTINPYHSPLNS